MTQKKCCIDSNAIDTAIGKNYINDLRMYSILIRYNIHYRNNKSIKYC